MDFKLTFVPGYISWGFSSSAAAFSSSAARFPGSSFSGSAARFPGSSFSCSAARFPGSSFSCSAAFSSSAAFSLDHRRRLTCAPNTGPFVCRARRARRVRSGLSRERDSERETLRERKRSGGSRETDRERETALRERFEKWCQTHGVVYGGKEEWLRRFEIYKTNLQHIDYHNSLNLSSKLSDNKFADLTEAEFRARYCGARVKTPEVVSEYEKHDESDFDSEHGPVTAILEPESELQLDSHQEEEEEEENVTLDVLSDDEEVGDEAVESENSSLERPAK